MTLQPAYYPPPDLIVRTIIRFLRLNSMNSVLSTFIAVAHPLVRFYFALYYNEYRGIV